MKCPIEPLGDKIVILPQEEEEQMYGNIIVPDTGQERPEIGTVLAVGPGRYSTDGTLIPNKIKKGYVPPLNSPYARIRKNYPTHLFKTNY